MTNQMKRNLAVPRMTALFTLPSLFLFSALFAAPASGQTNIAPSGTGYVWHTMPSATGTNNQAASSGINDGNLSTAVTAYPGGSESTSNQYEGGGVIFPTAQSGITQVVFINGAITTGGDGYFEKSIALQTYNRSDSVASVSGLSGTGAGIGTIIAFKLIGHFSDARQSAGLHSFDPIVVVAGPVPFVGMILVLLLVRNTRATDEGFVRPL